MDDASLLLDGLLGRPRIEEHAGYLLLDESGAARAIVTFNGTNKGEQGYTSVAVADAKLFGSTTFGGHDDYGVVFSVSENGSGYTLLHSFSGSGDSSFPRGNLLTNAAGSLFGTTRGEFGPSELFEIKLDGTYLHAHDFTTAAGEYLPSSIIMDTTGTIFGATQMGVDGCNYKGHKPPNECGVVYSYVPATGVFTVLHSFKGRYDGAFPLLGGVNGNGTLFGATTAGGAYGLGTLFALRRNATGYSYQALHSFTGGADGGTPNQPYADSHGNMTGTTQTGGAGGSTAKGTLFSLPRDGVLTTPYTFTAATGGIDPMGSVTPGGGGVFYGTTWGNGTMPCTRPDGTVINEGGCGTIWKYTP